MRIYQIAHYQVKPAAVQSVKHAIEEFVHYIKLNEPGTEVYLAWQQKADPTRFSHIFIFKDEEAHERHGASEAVKHFEASYSPHLVGASVDFVDYEWIGGKLPGLPSQA